MNIVPPIQSERFSVTITAEGHWATNYEDPHVFGMPPGFVVSQSMNVDTMQAKTSVSLSTSVAARSAEEAIADVVEQTNRSKCFYPGWLNDASAYEVSAQYVRRDGE